MIALKQDNKLTNLEEIAEYYSNTALAVIEDIQKFAEIETWSHTAGTNTLHIPCEWSQKKLGENLKRISKMQHIIGFAKLSNPIEELKDAKDMHDFFKVIAYGNSLLELNIKEIIIKHFQQVINDNQEEKIKKLNFASCIFLIYSIGLINKNLFDDLNYIRNKRNDIIHLTTKNNFVSKQSIKEMENISNKIIKSLTIILRKNGNSIFLVAMP